MVELQKDKAKIEAAGARLVAISYDPADKLKAFADDKKIEYPLLSDAGSETIKAYGIHHQDGYPHPGTYVIDRSGVVRAAMFEGGIRKRHTSADLIAAIESVGAAPEKPE